MTAHTPLPHSWLCGLQRGSVGGGLWSDAAWYDANLDKRMPLHAEMIRRMVHALPPMPDRGARTLDFLGGSRAASAAVAAAYPHVAATVIDSSAERLQRATQRFQRAGLPLPATLTQTVSTSMECVASGGFHLIVASLALHHLMEHNSSCDRASEFARWSSLLLRSLVPGLGHLFVCDHTGQLPLFTQLQLLHAAGFVDVDVAWRVDDMFVIGCRRPADNEAAEAGAAKPATSSSQLAGAAAHMQSTAANAIAAAPSFSFSSLACCRCSFPCVRGLCSCRLLCSYRCYSCCPSCCCLFCCSCARSPLVSDGRRRGQPHDRCAAGTERGAHSQTQRSASNSCGNNNSAAAASAPTPAPAASSPSSAAVSSPLTAALLSKLSLLFNRFDPSRSGQLSYAALQSLCRAVGRDPESETDGAESLWWTYQSLALPDPESGQVGLSIEDLSEHFYKNGMWSLEHDLRKLNMHA